MYLRFLCVRQAEIKSTTLRGENKWQAACLVVSKSSASSFLYIVNPNH